MSDATYRDPWLDYKAVFELTKKKFLKKPNYSQALAEYSRLSLRFHDEECEQYAALCHMQMASIYEALNDWNLQYSHLLKAARLLLKVETRNHEMCTAICSDGLNTLQDCYNKASKLILDQNGVWLAGLHQMELGNALYRLDLPSLAVKYLSRGARLLEVEHFSRIAALSRLAECQSELGLFADALSTIDDLWTAHMKNAIDPQFGFGKELLANCELACVLLLIRSKDLHTSNEISPRHRHLLAMYDEERREKKDSSTASQKKDSVSSAVSNEFPPKDSALSRDQFIHLYDFVVALHQGDVKTATRSFVSMRSFLNVNTMSAKLASDLISLVRRYGKI